MRTENDAIAAKPGARVPPPVVVVLRPVLDPHRQDVEAPPMHVLVG